MKKLNKKGFTLIELLAVIVVLAIVMVVAIPSILNSVDDAKKTSLQNATATVALWFTKQYELTLLGTNIGDDAVSKTYSDVFSSEGLPPESPTENNLTDALLKASGIAGGTSDVEGKVYLNGDLVCVSLKATKNGEFYNNVDPDKNSAKSAGCP